MTQIGMIRVSQVSRFGQGTDRQRSRRISQARGTRASTAAYSERHTYAGAQLHDRSHFRAKTFNQPRFPLRSMLSGLSLESDDCGQ